jgi:hypothetical protein
MKRILYLVFMLFITVSFVISCGPTKQAVKPTAKQKQEKGYPKPAHIFSAKYPSVDQLYLGEQLPGDQIALIGTYTWVNGNNKIKLKSVRNTVTGDKWIVPKGSSGFHDFLEAQPGTYELHYNDPFSGEPVNRIVTIVPGETYSLYPDQIKPEGKAVTQTVLSKGSSRYSRYILLPHIDNLKDSRNLTMLCGRIIKGSSITTSIMEFKTFHVDHSTKVAIERGIGKSVNSQEEGGLGFHEYQSQVYKTELEEMTGESVSSNTTPRGLTLVFDKAGVLKKIILP